MVQLGTLQFELFCWNQKQNQRNNTGEKMQWVCMPHLKGEVFALLIVISNLNSNFMWQTLLKIIKRIYAAMNQINACKIMTND